MFVLLCVIGLVGFDGDDMLWKSEDYYCKVEQDYFDLLLCYVDVYDIQIVCYLLEVQQCYLGIFGYGVKSMILLMIEVVIDIIGQCIEVKDIQCILEIGYDILCYLVELIDGVCEVVVVIVVYYLVVLIIKGDLFYQEVKIKVVSLVEFFLCIEIVFEKDLEIYVCVLVEFDLLMQCFVMVGNLLCLDIELVVILGGWGVYILYVVIWVYEIQYGVVDDESWMVIVDIVYDWLVVLVVIEVKVVVV